MLHGISPMGIAMRVVAFVLCLFLIMWGVFPTLTGRFHSGCVTLIAVGTVGAVVSLAFPMVAALWERVWQIPAGKILLCVLTTGVGSLAALFFTLSICMVGACMVHPQENATVLVLGAALRGDQPSALLRGRLEEAYAYLVQHPNAVCIVSGGQGDDEICTEASVMKRYLVEKGIAASRIYEESVSTSTFENIKHSRVLIEEHGLSKNIAVVTQEFHQFRAQQFVKRAGLTVSGAVTASTPWYLLGSYWIRDFAGICHMFLLGS